MEPSKQSVGVGEVQKKALRIVGERCSQWLEDAERQRKQSGMRQKRKERSRSHIWKTATQRISHPTTCSMSDGSLVSSALGFQELFKSAAADHTHLYFHSLGNVPRNVET